MSVLNRALIAGISVIALTLAGCAGTPSAARTADTPSPRSQSASQDSAALALLRYMAAYNDVGTDNDARVRTLCAGIGTRVDALEDLSPAQIKRLSRSLARNVVPASQCTPGQQARAGDGTPARFIYVEKQSQADAEGFIFRGGYYEANLGAAQGRYRVQRSADDWYITPTGPEAIS